MVRQMMRPRRLKDKDDQANGNMNPFDHKFTQVKAFLLISQIISENGQNLSNFRRKS